MKWLIASDLHGSKKYCRMLLEAYQREEAERLLLLGDILFGKLVPARQKREVADMLGAMAERIDCVRGNCDSDADVAMLRFPVAEGYIKIPVGKHTVFVTHGHVYNETNLPPEMGQGDVLLHGHTHVPKAQIGERFLCFNPGSVTLPLENSIRGYMTMEDGLFRWMTMEGEEYRRYDLEREPVD